MYNFVKELNKYGNWEVLYLMVVEVGKYCWIIFRLILVVEIRDNIEDWFINS